MGFNNDFIGIFDSGLGGISVLKEISRELPYENLVYYGDSANAPYGERSQSWIINRSTYICEDLLNKGAKAIVIACNTATSAAAEVLRDKYKDTPIIGVEPALKPAIKAAENILVMATPITLHLDKYQHLAKSLKGNHVVIDAPCPGLAERIEKANLESGDLVELIESLVGQYEGMVDAAVLGCTHYPFAARAIKQVLGDIKLFDGAKGTARQLRRCMYESGILSGSNRKDMSLGKVEFLSSNDNSKTIELYESFFQKEL